MVTAVRASAMSRVQRIIVGKHVFPIMEARNEHRVREHEDFPVVLLHITCGEAGSVS